MKESMIPMAMKGKELTMQLSGVITVPVNMQVWVKLEGVGAGVWATAGRTTASMRSIAMGAYLTPGRNFIGN
jgi:hypothetical protein